MDNRKLGILAGKGELPWIAVRNAMAMGESPLVFLLTEEPPPKEFEHISYRVILTKFYSSVIRTLKKFRIRRVVSLGKIQKTILNNRASFDLRTLYLLSKMHNKNDYTIFLYLKEELEKHGIEILPQTLYLQDCFLEEGRYGKSLTPKQIEDIAFGFRYARAINELDIGQCVMVGDKTVWAVEGPEGTDACILRGGSLYPKGGIVCKVAKKNHDPRFDIPVIGETTLRTMKEANCKVLAIESRGTIVVRKNDFLKLARKYGITVLSVEKPGEDTETLKKINRKKKL